MSKIERGIRISLFPGIYDRCMVCNTHWATGKRTNCPTCEREGLNK